MHQQGDHFISAAMEINFPNWILSVKFSIFHHFLLSFDNKDAEYTKKTKLRKILVEGKNPGVWASCYLSRPAQTNPSTWSPRSVCVQRKSTSTMDQQYQLWEPETMKGVIMYPFTDQNVVGIHYLQWYRCCHEKECLQKCVTSQLSWACASAQSDQHFLLIPKSI